MISHFHRTVFVHIQKCGGQSIESAFLADLGLTWEQRAQLLLRPNDNPNRGPPRLAHLLARDYTRYQYISSELFESYYSFAVLRDPAARVVSMFNYFQLTDTSGMPLSFDRFIYEWLVKQFERQDADDVQKNSITGSYYAVRPQTDFIMDLDERVMVKDVFRLEHLSENFAEIQMKSNLRSELGHRNKSVQSFTKDELNQKHNALIRQLYARDYEFIASMKRLK